MFNITGNTFPHKDTLKAWGCKWNSTGKSWDTARADVYRRGMELANGTGRRDTSRNVTTLRPIAPKTQPVDIRIEFPSRGATYCNNVYGVYKYGTYGRGSVLAGQQSRQFLDTFTTLEEAMAKYPGAELCGCGYQEPYLNHLSDEADY